MQMMDWIETTKDQYINLEFVFHVWMEHSVNGYFIMGEITQTGEEVVLSPSFEKEDDCRYVLIDLMRTDRIHSSQPKSKENI